MVLSLERLTHPSSKNTEQQVFEAPTKTQSNLWSYREILPALLWHGNQGEATTRRLASPCAPGWPPRRANAGSWKRIRCGGIGGRRRRDHGQIGKPAGLVAAY